MSKDRLGAAVFVVGLIAWAVSELGVALAVIALGAAVVWANRDRLAHLVRCDDAPGPIEQAHAEYVAGDLSESELERRLGRILDPQFDRIHAACSKIDGISDERSDALRAEFGTLERIRDADAVELTAAHGIGDGLAAELERELR